MLRQRGITTGLIVDLGRGTGVCAGVLTRAGYSVLSVDTSSSMLRIARRCAPRPSLCGIAISN
jgi:predicted RNA methylase